MIEPLASLTEAIQRQRNESSYCYSFPKCFSIMDLVAKCFQNLVLKLHKIHTLMVQNTQNCIVKTNDVID